MNNKGLKKALLIGINYIADPNNRLNGCINDVLAIQKQLNKYYPLCTNIRILTDDKPNPATQPTRKNILDGIAWLLADLKPGDNIYIHYSGHGGLMRDRNRDETSGMDSCIYPICNNKIEVILDDELKALLANKIPKGCKCFAVFDCCHSGTSLDLRYNINCPTYGTIVFTQDNKQTATNGSVILLSGCTDAQTAADTVNKVGVPSGALTNALLDIWNTYGVNIKLKHLLWNMRKLLQTQGYPQIPQLSCGNNLNIDSIFDLN
jgi:hypothetical protein